MTAPRQAGLLGRLPNDPARLRLCLTERHLDASVPPNPSVVDWLSRVDTWPMFDNDRIGDCVFAAIGHMIAAFTSYGEGATILVSDDDIVHAYSAVTGYNPDDPSSDQGTVVQDALEYWRVTGIAGHRILAYAQLDHNRLDLVEAAINVFGAVMVGVNLPASAINQFNQGEPWESVNPDGGIAGGHAVNAGYFNTPDQYVRVITWGQPQDATDAWFASYVDEVWAVVSPEWLDATGHSPEGLDLAALGEDFAELTREPNPFPGPTPPAPQPSPDPDDAELAVVAQQWCRNRHSGLSATLARLLRGWLHRNGYTP